MDMEDDDTIEVFTQQSGGREDLEETNEKYNHETKQSGSTLFQKTIINKQFYYSVIHQQLLPKHLTRSNYRRKESDKNL